MFASVAPRYDLLNHLLSFNIDRGWRKALRNELQNALANADSRVLDLCCGTGDVLLDLQPAAAAHVIGADFCYPMLMAAKKKITRAGLDSALAAADALALPFASGALDAIAISFGFRNLVNYKAGLIEFYRVLKPGGTLAILEFSHPENACMKAGYKIYSRIVLPLVGSVISGSREAYTYLPDSIRKFPTASELARLVSQSGFRNVRYRLLTGGIAALHLGDKA
jgi:demethylmenaquinone methyltransferase/2-methoxy-6-polyprenyl-1,4-benzoquinol methylase